MLSSAKKSEQTLNLTSLLEFCSDKCFAQHVGASVLSQGLTCLCDEIKILDNSLKISNSKGMAKDWLKLQAPQQPGVTFKVQINSTLRNVKRNTACPCCVLAREKMPAC